MLTHLLLGVPPDATLWLVGACRVQVLLGSVSALGARFDGDSPSFDVVSPPFESALPVLAEAGTDLRLPRAIPTTSVCSLLLGELVRLGEGPSMSASQRCVLRISAIPEMDTYLDDYLCSDLPLEPWSLAVRGACVLARHPAATASSSSLFLAGVPSAHAHAVIGVAVDRGLPVGGNHHATVGAGAALTDGRYESLKRKRPRSNSNGASNKGACRTVAQVTHISPDWKDAVDAIVGVGDPTPAAVASTAAELGMMIGSSSSSSDTIGQWPGVQTTSLDSSPSTTRVLPQIVISGGKGAGKSTLARYVCNRLLSARSANSQLQHQLSSRSGSDAQQQEQQQYTALEGHIERSLCPTVEHSLFHSPEHSLYPAVAWLDIDLGQPEHTPAGLISLSIVHAPILCPPHVRCHWSADVLGTKNAASGVLEMSRVAAADVLGSSTVAAVDLDRQREATSYHGTSPATVDDQRESHPYATTSSYHVTSPSARVCAARFFGTTSPKSDPGAFRAAVTGLLREYRVHLAPLGVPLIVNTHGWVRGVGLETNQAVVEDVAPTHVVYLTSGEQTGYDEHDDSAQQMLHADTSTSTWIGDAGGEGAAGRNDVSAIQVEVAPGRRERRPQQQRWHAPLFPFSVPPICYQPGQLRNTICMPVSPVVFLLPSWHASTHHAPTSTSLSDHKPTLTSPSAPAAGAAARPQSVAISPLAIAPGARLPSASSAGFDDRSPPTPSPQPSSKLQRRSPAPSPRPTSSPLSVSETSTAVEVVDGLIEEIETSTSVDGLIEEVEEGAGSESEPTSNSSPVVSPSDSDSTLDVNGLPDTFSDVSRPHRSLDVNGFHMAHTTHTSPSTAAGMPEQPRTATAAMPQQQSPTATTSSQSQQQRLQQQQRQPPPRAARSPADLRSMRLVAYLLSRLQPSTPPACKHILDAAAVTAAASSTASASGADAAAALDVEVERCAADDSGAAAAASTEAGGLLTCSYDTADGASFTSAASSRQRQPSSQSPLSAPQVQLRMTLPPAPQLQLHAYSSCTKCSSHAHTLLFSSLYNAVRSAFWRVLSERREARAPVSGIESPAFALQWAEAVEVPAADVRICADASEAIELGRGGDSSSSSSRAMSNRSPSATTATATTSTRAAGGSLRTHHRHSATLLEGLRGQIVGLCSTTTAEAMVPVAGSSGTSSSSSIASDDGTMPAHSSSTDTRNYYVPASSLPCLGVGFVRSVDARRGVITLVTPVLLPALSAARVDVLVSWSGPNDAPPQLLYRGAAGGDAWAVEASSVAQTIVAAAKAGVNRQNLQRRRLG